MSQWYFEVWNEPNIDFWAGAPREQTYFQLYDAAARAVKSVSPRLRIGGPATAQAAWADRFIQHTVKDHVPVDFVSTHVYGNDSAPDVFGTHDEIPRTQMVCRAVRKVHDQISASALPHVPLIWSEFNASYKNEPDVTDSTYMGPWMADTIRQCDGLVDMMSYWTFSDVFEEQGVVKRPFYGGFGLLAEDGLPKPAFNAFKLLHRLGENENSRERRQRSRHAPRRWRHRLSRLEYTSGRRRRRTKRSCAAIEFTHRAPESNGVPRGCRPRFATENLRHNGQPRVPHVSANPIPASSRPTSRARINAHPQR